MDGQIIVLSSTGTMITQVVVLQGSEIISLTWSCEKFNMDESSAEQNENFTAPTGKSLSVCLKIWKLVGNPVLSQYLLFILIKVYQRIT